MLVSFDLEIAEVLPEDVTDWKQYRPLGISCAATEDEQGERWSWWSPGKLSKRGCMEIVRDLQSLVNKGHTIVTLNGLGFDFDVLAEESGLYDECGELALNHVDLMFIVVCTKGHYLGLDAMCQGMGIEGKMKKVRLKDGTILEDMSGAKAPELWAQGEHEAVLAYLYEDVRSTLEVAQAVRDRQKIEWISRSGRLNKFTVPDMYTVEEALRIPLPYTDWMKNPPSRGQFMEWIPDYMRDIRWG